MQRTLSYCPNLLVHLEECRPGLGSLDYTVFLKEASNLVGISVMLEHLEKQEDYKYAADYVREIAGKAGIILVE